MEDLGDDLGEEGWELMRIEETTKLAADTNGITCFPLFKLTFGFEDIGEDAMRSALSEHLQMAELSLGSRSDDVSVADWDALQQKAAEPGISWSDLDTVILMNPRVVLV